LARNKPFDLQSRFTRAILSATNAGRGVEMKV
jgi:hypothetical protein